MRATFRTSTWPTNERSTKSRGDQLEIVRAYVEALRDHWLARAEHEQLPAGRVVRESTAPGLEQPIEQAATTSERLRCVDGKRPARVRRTGVRRNEIAAAKHAPRPRDGSDHMGRQARVLPELQALGMPDAE